jgi:alkanesulfonate monooxygenase SsuD/methylene tetrahydromethanopterin reductase-like flavin-dependent oxidoreductase (luciferase family)
MAEVKIHPAPLQLGGPSVIVAGRQEPAMRRAAILGNGWIPYIYSRRRYADSADTLRGSAEAAGRDLSDPLVCLGVLNTIWTATSRGMNAP